MKAWQVREKHENDMIGIFKKLGFTDKLGRLRKFSGPLFWPEMKKLGHDRGVLESCQCWTSQPESVRRKQYVIGATKT